MLVYSSHKTSPQGSIRTFVLPVKISVVTLPYFLAFRFVLFRKLFSLQSEEFLLSAEDYVDSNGANTSVVR